MVKYNKSKMKHNNNKINIFLGFTIVLFLFDCNTLFVKPCKKSTNLTIIISCENRSKQQKFYVWDWNTNLEFTELIKDSVFQIQQALLTDTSLLSVQGRYSCTDFIHYYKKNKEDTIKVYAKYCLPIY